MKQIKYTSPNTIPSAMRKELAAAPHAGEAEKIFNKWSDRCYVEPRSRAFIYTEA